MSSLSRITEDCTSGAVVEDVPHTIPRRQQSSGSRSVSSATGEVINHQNGGDDGIQRSLESIREESRHHLGTTGNNDDSASRRTSKSRNGRRSHSSDTMEAEEKNEVDRRRRSSSRSSRSKRQRKDAPASSEASGKRSAKSTSQRRSTLSHRRSSSASDLQRDRQTSNIRTRIPSTNSLRSISSHRLSAELKKSKDLWIPSSHHHRSSDSSDLGNALWGIGADGTILVGHQSDFNSLQSSNLERRGADNAPSDADGSASVESEEELPGAYRVSSHSTQRLSVCSGHSFAVSSEADSVVASVPSFGGISHETPSSTNRTVVTAEVARDIEQDIEAAREEGRAEGLALAPNRERNIVVAVAQTQPPKEGVVNRGMWLLPFGLCWCLIIVAGAAGYFALNPQEENEAIATTVVPEDGAELDATFSFDPPTVEDCASIASGTDVVGQEDMFSQFVDMQVQITSESEQDTAFLVGLLQEQVQSKLMPLLVGCDDAQGNVIGNGVVDSVKNETSTCLFQNNPLCLEVILTLKIYLVRKEDGSTVVKILSDILLDEDLNETLNLPPEIQIVDDPYFTPSSNVSSEVPSESPSWSPSMVDTEGGDGPPSASSSTRTPSTEPSSWQVPATNPADPTTEPTIQQTSRPSTGPSSVPTTASAGGNQQNIGTEPPVLDYQDDESAAPSLFPTRIPSGTPTISPSASPSESPSFKPTPIPSTQPTTEPSRLPTGVPSELPTAPPSAFPTSRPTLSPTANPTVSPAPTITAQPSPSPTITPQPSLSGFYWISCGRKNGCNGKQSSVQNANNEFVDAIPSALDEDMIAVRCCSDIGLDGFYDPRSESCPYAKSNIGGCHETATYWEAENVCSSVGARLCTLEEIQNSCASTSGCGHNHRMAWTSTQGSP